MKATPTHDELGTDQAHTGVAKHGQTLKKYGTTRTLKALEDSGGFFMLF
jgi:hypothetical protein